ncbi:MAG TPA: hypothetical protein VGE98_14845 [Thermoanaerobaculia bacterium]
MNKQRPTRKLTLRFETLRQIDRQDWIRIAGGTGSPCTDTCDVDSFNTCYQSCTGC